MKPASSRLGTVALMLLVGCSGESTAQDSAAAKLELAVCDLLQRCGCTPMDCGEGDLIGPTYNRDDGLVFDPQCADSWAERLRSVSCGYDSALRNLEVLQPSCAEHCSLFHGSALAGQPCERMGLFGSAFDNASDCGPGLVCHAGECTDPCVVALPTAGQPCTLSLECAPGARCDTQVADAPVCVALIADGVACTGHDQCVSGHCPDGRCRPQLTEGQACTDNLRCADGLSCEDGVCRSSTAALCQGVLFELLD